MPLATAPAAPNDLASAMTASSPPPADLPAPGGSALLDFAAGIEQGAATGTGAPAEPSAEDKLAAEQADKAMTAAIGAIGGMVTGFLRARRAAIARRMPEIREHWPDEMLTAPGLAVPPVINRYAPMLFKALGNHPELGALCFSMLPLVMGYMSAVGEHAAKEERTVDVPAAPRPPAAAPTPRPTQPPAPTQTPVFHVGGAAP